MLAKESFAESAEGEMEEVIAALLSAPEYVNPAIQLARELMAAETREDQEVLKRLTRPMTIEDAIVAGEREGAKVLNALKGCGHSPPIASVTVPVGF